MTVNELERNPNGTIDGNLDRYDRREKCNRCGQRNPIGFDVDDRVWKVVHDRAVEAAAAWDEYKDLSVKQGPYDVLCINCFTSVADWHGIEWEFVIKFYPVSRYTMTRREMDLEKVGT